MKNKRMLLSTGTAAAQCLGQTINLANVQQSGAFLKQLLILHFEKRQVIK